MYVHVHNLLMIKCLFYTTWAEGGKSIRKGKSISLVAGMLNYQNHKYNEEE
jgi:hypothetical protein